MYLSLLITYTIQDKTNNFQNNLNKINSKKVLSTIYFQIFLTLRRSTLQKNKIIKLNIKVKINLLKYRKELKIIDRTINI